MEKFRILSDIFAVPGLFCLFFGGLRWLAGQGAFRGLGYILENALRLLTFQQAKPYQPKETKKTGVAGLLITGVVCIVISGLFAGLYYL